MGIKHGKLGNLRTKRFFLTGKGKIMNQWEDILLDRFENWRVALYHFFLFAPLLQKNNWNMNDRVHEFQWGNWISDNFSQ